MEPRVTPGRILLALVLALFVLGFVGWLVQGGGDDETVPTVVPTTLAPPTIIAPPAPDIAPTSPQATVSVP